MADIIQQWADAARAINARILLPEVRDPRILKAASIAMREGLCRPMLLGVASEIARVASEAGIAPAHLPPVLPLRDHPRFFECCEAYSEMRSSGDKQTTPKSAARLLSDPLFFAAMLLRIGEVDSVVAGAVYTTADVVRAARYIVGPAENVKEVSSCFVMQCRDTDFGENGMLVFADAAVLVEPDTDQLADIALASAATARRLLQCEPRVAFLSFSTHGSASHPRIERIKAAVELVRTRAPGLCVDGELQVDAALIPEVASRKTRESAVAGRANVLIFPDLNSGNIAYKLVERLAGARAFGPLLQGVRQPICDLSRGASVEDIVQVITLTSLMRRF